MREILRALTGIALVIGCACITGFAVVYPVYLFQGFGR